MKVRNPYSVLHSFSVKNIFYDKMDLRLFYFDVVKWKHLQGILYNLASDFVAKLPPSSNKYEVSSVRNYQNILGLLPSKFKFSNARRL